MSKVILIGNMDNEQAIKVFINNYIIEKQFSRKQKKDIYSVKTAPTIKIDQEIAKDDLAALHFCSDPADKPFLSMLERTFGNYLVWDIIQDLVVDHAPDALYLEEVI